MNSKDYLKDLSEIKDLMHRSSRFISLSGLSGIMAGIYAIIGAAVAYWLVQSNDSDALILEDHIFIWVLIDLFCIAALSIATSVYLTTRKARAQGEALWDTASKRMIINFLIPLLAGGLYILIVLDQYNFGESLALMLIFYGLALVNAAKYSLGDIRYLGIIEIGIGLLAALFVEHAFWFWILGFGAMHIIYGIWMVTTYENRGLRKK